MQATNKLFRNCPFKFVDFESCSECPNYKRCIKKKKERKYAKRVKRLERFLNVTLPIIMMLATLTIAVCAIIMCAISVPEKSEGANDTVATTTNFSEVIEPENESKVDSDFEEELSKEEIFEEEVFEEIVVEAKVSAEGPGEVYYYNLSEDEKLLIAKLVWAESRGESFEGKVAVAAVVINRYFYGNNQFGKTIKGVITAPSQFASIENVTTANLKDVPECMEAVEAACKGWDPTRAAFQEGALFFYAPKWVKGYQKEIRDGIEVMVIGNHNFHVNFEKVK